MIIITATIINSSSKKKSNQREGERGIYQRTVLPVTRAMAEFQP